jgi:hypothetical protein
MSAIAGDVLVREAEFSHREGSFTGGSVAVGITPDTIVL